MNDFVLKISCCLFWHDEVRVPQYLLLRFIPWGPNRSHFRQLKVYNVFISGAIVLFLDNEQIFWNTSFRNLNPYRFYSFSQNWKWTPILAISCNLISSYSYKNAQINVKNICISFQWTFNEISFGLFI